MEKNGAQVGARATRQTSILKEAAKRDSAAPGATGKSDQALSERLRSRATLINSAKCQNCAVCS